MEEDLEQDVAQFLANQRVFAEPNGFVDREVTLLKGLPALDNNAAGLRTA